MELVAAALGLVVFSPVLLVCAALVKISSKGEILFRQERVGRNGQLFTLFKFRTMRTDNHGPAVTASDDDRITAIGRFLRKYKLDELPEIYNVLRGDMSFVGARPEVPEMVDLSNEVWAEVLTVRPGITDPVTLCLRNEEAFLAGIGDKEAFYREVLQPFKLDGYLKYLRIRTAWKDVKVIAETAKVIFSPDKAPQPTLEDIRFKAIEKAFSKAGNRLFDR